MPKVRVMREVMPEFVRVWLSNLGLEQKRKIWIWISESDYLKIVDSILETIEKEN